MSLLLLFNGLVTDAGPPPPPSPDFSQVIDAGVVPVVGATVRLTVDGGGTVGLADVNGGRRGIT